MTEFEFVDELPPRTIRNQARDLLASLVVIEEFAEALKARPDQWGVWPLPDQPRPVTDIRHGRPRAFRDGRFDAQTRNGVVYVRYLGKGVADDEQ